jgi:two-component system alkaline phosphatase synthesis response regulator PhoP
MRGNILLVEDEEAVRTTLSDRLRLEGYVVDTANDGEEGMEKLASSPVDLLILDVMLPYRSGFDLCRDVRQAGFATPILFLTARGELVDKVLGFKLGGDDYLTKPFHATELLVRIEALLRRAPVQTGRGVHQIGSLRIDVARKDVTRDGKPVHAGRTLSREELLREVWGYDSDAYTKTVDVHVFSLRKKLEEDPGHPELIITVKGVGYRFKGSRDI